MKKLALVVAAPLLAVVMVVSWMMLGSTTPQSRHRCAPAGYSAALLPGGGAWTVPIGRPYTVTAEYGWRIHPVRGGSDLHGGIDLATGGGAPVLAATAGVVSGVVDLGDASYGLYVTIDHGGGVATRYAHLATSLVTTGQTVATGQQIGVEGASGGVTGPHLHFEVIINGSPVETRAAMQSHGLTFDGRPGTLINQSAVALASTAVGPVQGVDRSAELTTAQLETASQIVNTGRKLGLPPKAWLIAVAVAIQESDLGADPTSLTPNTDGDVGPFQQRALLGWYADGATISHNVIILTDPTYAARTFYLGHDVGVRHSAGGGPMGYHIPGLVDIAGWDSMPLWQAGAKVQRPAAQYETAYAKHEATAAGVISRVTGDPAGWQAAAACKPGAESLSLAGINGTGAGAQAAAAALAKVGTPYSWGGGTLTGTSTGICCSPGGQDGRLVNGFDCSGLTRYAWAQAGVTLARTSDDQMATTTSVPTGQIRAGDLLFFPGHVGIADGNGGMIHAPRPGRPVELLPNVLTDSYYGPRLIGVGRPTTT